MVHPQRTCSHMELLPLVCLCLLSCSGTTSADPAGAAPEPSVTILDETNDWARLQCKAHGVPDLEVHWQDSDGNKLPAEEPQVLGSDHKYITVNTTVTKTGHFSCVATQMNLSHRISAQIYVHLNEAEPQSDNTGLVVGAILGTLLVAAVVFGVVLYMREQKHKRELKEKDMIIEGSRRDTERSDNPAEDSALTRPVG